MQILKSRMQAVTPASLVSDHHLPAAHGWPVDIDDIGQELPHLVEQERLNYVGRLGTLTPGDFVGPAFRGPDPAC